MSRTQWKAIAAITLIGFTLALVGCLGLLSPSGEDDSMLAILEPTNISGSTWRVDLIVNDVPDGGLAGILVEQGGLVFTNVIASSIEATGMGGFVVTAQDFSEGSANGMLIAINTADGVSDGKVIRLTFLAAGDPSVTLDLSKIVLSSDLNTQL